jgi:hypothetical protein
MDPRAILGTVEKKIIPCRSREWNPSHPVRSLVAIPPELFRLSLLEHGEEDKYKKRKRFEDVWCCVLIQCAHAGISIVMWSQIYV